MFHSALSQQPKICSDWGAERLEECLPDGDADSDLLIIL